MRQSTSDVIDPPSTKKKKPASSGGKSRLRRLKPIDVSPKRMDRFRRACGLTRPYIVRISSSESGGGPLPVLWDRPSLIVGRGADCDLRLPHTEISRQHAYFQLLDDRIFCADLGSRSGTHWSNGASQAGWVPANEPVSLGPYSLTFEPAPPSIPFQETEFADAEMAEELEDVEFHVDQEASNSEATFLDFVNAGPKVRRFQIGRDVTLIGSGDGVRIRLSNSTVSNVHCAVVRTPAGLWIVDLLSADGTIVNGRVDPVAPLHPGDEFQVGRFLVEVNAGDSASAEGSTLDPVPAQSDVPESHETIAPRPDQMTNGHSLAEPSAASTGPTHLAALNQLARLSGERQHAAGTPAAAEGLSEEFVLNIIKELGVMQQQALQHAQQSMRETLSQLSSTYQQRIDALEQQHSALRDQLHGLAAEQRLEPRRLGVAENEEVAASGTPRHAPERELQDDPYAASHLDVDESVFDTIKPEHREQWIRDQIKTVEAELDKTRKGWGRKLVDLLGY